MSEFQELVKSLTKSRDYVRDFYIYGFKSREDFYNKSLRTYDNERRRIESWLAPYIRSCYHGNVKTVSLSLNTNLLSQNPLCRIYEAKSFTNNDILLHFYLLDILQADCFMTADELSDAIMDRFQVEIETQLVRKKANEYVAEGIFQTKKQGKRLYYFRTAALSFSENIWNAIAEALCFYQLDAPLSFIGYSLMKRLNTTNSIFCVKHGYFVHVLEDEILLSLLTAINERREVLLKVQSNKAVNSRIAVSKAASGKTSSSQTASCRLTGCKVIGSKPAGNIPANSNLPMQAMVQKMHVLPLRISVSTRTGRRYLCVRRIQEECFYHIRLDHIKEVTLLSENIEFPAYQKKLLKHLPKCFGVCFGNNSHLDEIRLTLSIQEPHELYILNRLETEGRGGTVTRIAEHTYTYVISVYEGMELMPWIKTFIGRIILFESNNEHLRTKFYQDLETMAAMYEVSV